MSPRYPALYQVNTRAWLTDLSPAGQRPATLDDIPDAELDRLAALGFDWIWMLSVWQTGAAGREVSLGDPELRREFQATLPDLRDEDVAGSGFAITGYTVHERLGGDAALARLAARIRGRGLKLMLDFVPNHVGLGHPWVESHPERFIEGTEADLERAPRDYTRVARAGDALILACGRDPNYPGWSDTLQLDYANPDTQEAMRAELLKVAGQCDGVRCDMAMLLLPDVFERTWGRRPAPFWPGAIERTRRGVPGFCFLAEVYWDLEWTLLQQGFDYAYDKRLYDRVRDGRARPIREHLLAGLDYQDRLARFLENHDEPRAPATFAGEIHEAAAIITFLTPGTRFFHQGQLEGRTRRLPAQLVRAPVEPLDAGLQAFYERLLTVLRRPAMRDGCWRQIECVQAWDGNWTWDSFLAFAWQGAGDERLIVTVNYSATRGQCYVRVPFADLAGRALRLRDLMGPFVYDRDGDDIALRGLYLDLPPWGYHVFEVR